MIRPHEEAESDAETHWKCRSFKTMREGRFPVAHVPEAKAAVPRGLEALILAQSDVPTTGAQPNDEVERSAEGKSDAFPVVPVSCRIVWFLLLLLRV
jgi:hypothetical protein